VEVEDTGVTLAMMDNYRKLQHSLY